jgi:hypothetical protein
MSEFESHEKQTVKKQTVFSTKSLMSMTQNRNSAAKPLAGNCRRSPGALAGNRGQDLHKEHVREHHALSPIREWAVDTKLPPTTHKKQQGAASRAPLRVRQVEDLHYGQAASSGASRLPGHGLHAMICNCHDGGGTKLS